MLQINENFNLTRLAERILCPEHREPIISLNINPKAKYGERLICPECSPANQTVIFMKKAERLFNEVWKIETEGIKIEQQKFNEYISEMESRFAEIKKLLTNSFDLIQSQSKLASIVQQLASETCGSSTLQEIADFLSNQKIENGEIKMQDQFKLPTEFKQTIQESINQVSPQLDSLISTLKLKISQIKIKSSMPKEIKIDKQNFNLIELDGHLDSIKAVAMSNDEKIIASGGEDEKILLWDLNDKSLKQQIDLKCRIFNITFSPDDTLLAVGTSDDIQIFNLSNLESKIVLNNQTSIIWRTVFTSNSKYLISGSHDQTLRIWNLDQVKCNFTQKLSHCVYGVNISKDDKYISAGCNNGIAYLFDATQIESPKMLTQWTPHNYINGIIFTQDSKYILTCQQEIKMWSIENLISNTSQKIPFKVFKGIDEMWSMTLRMNDSILISIDGDIKMWNIESGELIQILEVPNQYGYPQDKSFAITQDIKKIITGGRNHKLKIYE